MKSEPIVITANWNFRFTNFINSLGDIMTKRRPIEIANEDGFLLVIIGFVKNV